jgi:hypothetical protein
MIYCHDLAESKLSGVIDTAESKFSGVIDTAESKLSSVNDTTESKLISVISTPESAKTLLGQFINFYRHSFHLKRKSNHIQARVNSTTQGL